jgi:hypothetical protein
MQHYYYFLTRAFRLVFCSCLDTQNTLNTPVSFYHFTLLCAVSTVLGVVSILNNIIIITTR